MSYPSSLREIARMVERRDYCLIFRDNFSLLFICDFSWVIISFESRLQTTWVNKSFFGSVSLVWDLKVGNGMHRIAICSKGWEKRQAICFSSDKN